jgi:Ca2+:H+ antiporter
VALMLAGGPEASALARDTVFAAVMIILNLMVGLSILVGGIKHHEQSFVLQGANAALIILVAISVFSFILPNYTQTVVGPYYSNKQLVFVAIVTLILYGSFIFVQNIKHRSHFLTEFEMGEVVENRPSAKATATSTLLLFVCLGAVVVLAESLAPSLEEFIQAIGAPHSLAGVIIACVVLLPEGLTAFKAAKQNQLQKSLNLSLGSAVASIGLTIPIVSLLAVFSGLQLTLGINAESSLLFVLSLFTIILSLSTGKTTILHGIVLLVIFMVYLFMLIFP